MTTVNVPIDYAARNNQGWAAVTLVSNPVERPAPTFGLRRSGKELENADLVAAREAGQKRHQAATAGQGANAKSVEARGWLAGDPFRWRGRRIQHRSSRSVFTVRQVYHSGRVELKKAFMLYLTSVQAIRADYDPAT